MPAWRTEGTVRSDTLLLVALAGCMLVLARMQSAWSPAMIACRGAVELLGATAVAFGLRSRARTEAQARQAVTFGVVLAATYPFAAEGCFRLLGEGSEPWEMAMLTSLQLAAVVLGMFAELPRLGGTAVLLSSFLLLFATTIRKDRPALILAAVYGALGLWWLMGMYWDRLAGAFVASSVERRVPFRLSVLGATLALLVGLSTLVGATGASAVALRGFMPTSGGTWWADPQARSGVGDGDALVAAQDQALSFGPVESELFLDSEMPSLYDMANDLYGEPLRRKTEFQRNIALAPSQTEEVEQRLAQAERSGREFSTLRRQAERSSRIPDDRRAAAMLYVVGPVPVHLALERYDSFDGREWTHSGTSGVYPPVRLQSQHGKPWAQFMLPGLAPFHRGEERHALKIINLKTNRFPAPPQFSAVHIDRIDQLDFFGWTPDGVGYMPLREHLPQLTVLHVKSRGVNLQPLRETRSAATRAPANGTPVAMNNHRAVASEWTTRISPGWRQVEAIVARLRSDFAVDRAAVPPAETSDVVAHFLATRRGPEYLFATTAAVLIRELGYPTRLVSGFYARPERYEHRAGQTTVLAEDVHTWLEVRASGDHWITVEPTPGYEPPTENLTWTQRLAAAWSGVIEWSTYHAGALTAAVLLAVAALLCRQMWLDLLGRACCRLLGMRSAAARLRWTIRLLEWRAWLAGCPRPSPRTIAAWYGPLIEQAPADQRPTLRLFFQWADRLLYSAETGLAAQSREIEQVCLAATTVGQRDVLRACLRDSWRHTP